MYNASFIVNASCQVWKTLTFAREQKNPLWYFFNSPVRKKQLAVNSSHSDTIQELSTRQLNDNINVHCFHFNYWILQQHRQHLHATQLLLHSQHLTSFPYKLALPSLPYTKLAIVIPDSFKSCQWAENWRGTDGPDRPECSSKQHWRGTETKRKNIHSLNITQYMLGWEQRCAGVQRAQKFNYYKKCVVKKFM